MLGRNDIKLQLCSMKIGIKWTLQDWKHLRIKIRFAVNHMNRERNDFCEMNSKAMSQ